MKNLFLIVTTALLFSSCAVTTPFLITNNPIGKKTGTSSTICLFAPPQAPFSIASQLSRYYHGLMLNKDFGIVEAAKNGGITKIGAIDLKVTSYIFFKKKEFIVSGE